MIKSTVLYSKKYIEHRIMDIFIPDKNIKRGCILFVHGGGWMKGKRSSWDETAQYFCAKGFFCASTDYRLAPQWKFPSQIEDIRLAMSFFKQKVKVLGINNPFFIVIGSSSGGHLASLLSTIDKDEALGKVDELEISNTRPDATVCFCPITTVKIWDDCPAKIPPMIEGFIGGNELDFPEIYQQASPIERIKGNEPPFLFIHGASDDTVPLWHSANMHNKLLQYNCKSKLIVLNGVGHGFGYGVTTDAQKRSVKHIEEFLAANLSCPS